MIVSNCLKSLILGLLVYGAVAQEDIPDEIIIYGNATLATVAAEEACIRAMGASVACYASLPRAVSGGNVWSSQALQKLCDKGCTEALESYISSVKDACGTSTYNISGSIETASNAGEELVWQQEATCLKSDSSDQYCSIELQEALAGGGNKNITCSQCYLDYLQILVNAEWGQYLVNKNDFESVVSSCSATGYSVTYTPTSTQPSPTETFVPRCNASEPNAKVYTVAEGDTCLSISTAEKVSTWELTNKNGLGTNCTYLAAGKKLCLPNICNTYVVKENDTCDALVEGLNRPVVLTQFLSWNRNINRRCSNLGAFKGTNICLSPPGTTALPESFGLKPATTPAPVPDDAVGTSNRNCGHWYQVQKDEECDDVAAKFQIDIKDFYFLNPQLNNSCTALWFGNSYCVQPVGNIATYTSYPIGTSFTRFESTADVHATRTVNRTTSYFFYSFPTPMTTHMPYNATKYDLVKGYTLCEAALSAYTITAELPEEAFANDEWMSEYQRVCLLNPDAALPTVAFNTSITLDYTPPTPEPTQSSSQPTPTATPGPGESVSPNGLCGKEAGYTCEGSQFGDCCSKFGYCGSGSDYCGTDCDPEWGTCQE
ncbi:hypothetical protein O1611_g3625 [Lasiodiplodia mahajangana]|uniref:Uncharacterized protein n=1 Tax=Lasiodiplodia mahajangana TaxID=1108764 RepID=A0ACC2JRA6_9PEZI|nr:hypothetical protein O1611_g3625 [Lasiodiplodia mahajangana]